MAPPVKLYALSTCSHCKNTKKLLNECQIKYDHVDVDLLEGADRETVIAEIKRLTNECAFPTIIIGDKIIVGFKEKAIREALGI